MSVMPRVRVALRARAGSGDLTRYERRVSSQNGEDGVIAELVRRCGVERRFFVEVGVGRGIQANCIALADREGWDGVLIDADAGFHAQIKQKYESVPRVRVINAVVTPDNIDRLLTDANVPSEIDVLSIDIDGADYWVWEALTCTRPRIVAIEYNAALPAARRLVQPLDAALEGWDATDYFGASLGALRALGAARGYTFAHTDSTGSNAFFVRDDLSARANLPPCPPEHQPNYLGKGLRHAPDPLRRAYLDLDEP